MHMLHYFSFIIFCKQNPCGASDNDWEGNDASDLLFIKMRVDIRLFAPAGFYNANECFCFIGEMDHQNL